MAFDFTSLIGPAIGGLFGAAGSSDGNKQTTQQTLDPRMADAVYGNLVPGATSWYQSNKSGLNPVMLQGLNQQYNALQDPFTYAGYNRMGTNGYNLMGGGVAGNPFTGGGLLSQGGYQPSTTSSGWGGGILGMGNSYGPFSEPTAQATTNGVTQNVGGYMPTRPVNSPAMRDYGGVGSEGVADNTGWGSMSAAEQAGFYGSHPGFAATTQAAQNLFGMTSLGKMQQQVDPAFVSQQQMIARGITPNSNSVDGGGYTGIGGTTSATGGGVAANPMGLDPAQAQGQNAANAGGGGGGTKIICTAMNEAYGFGSYRQAVWLKYSERMTKQHEVGYHAMFLPLVKYGFKSGDGIGNRIVRAVLEHGTRHRTADLRAEMYGRKRDFLGRIYRAIFEPLCFVVGKAKA